MENLVEASSTIAFRKMSLLRYDYFSRTLAEKTEVTTRFIHLKVPHKIALATACGTGNLLILLSIMILKWMCACLIPDSWKKSIASFPKV